VSGGRQLFNRPAGINLHCRFFISGKTGEINRFFGSWNKYNPKYNLQTMIFHEKTAKLGTWQTRKVKTRKRIRIPTLGEASSRSTSQKIFGHA